MNDKKNFVFTLTAGRTGTAYLADIFRANVADSEVHHEILGYDSFGIDTPEISHLTTFNSRGSTPHVRRFWEKKLAKVARSKSKYYVETSHILSKAGLAENIDLLQDKGIVHLIVLRRNIEKTLLSYLSRWDFINIGNMWMWYLDPNYPRNIVDSSQIDSLGHFGTSIWYLCEMQARAEYYKKKLCHLDYVVFHDVDLEELLTKDKVHNFLVGFGLKVNPENITIPPPANVSEHLWQLDESERKDLTDLLSSLKFDAREVARAYIARESSL